jgi:hypothetical protein
MLSLTHTVGCNRSRTSQKQNCSHNSLLLARACFEILIMLLGAFSTDLLPGDRLDIVEKGLRHQGLTDAWLEM